MKTTLQAFRNFITQFVQAENYLLLSSSNVFTKKNIFSPPASFILIFAGLLLSICINSAQAGQKFEQGETKRATMFFDSSSIQHSSQYNADPVKHAEMNSFSLENELTDFSFKATKSSPNPDYNWKYPALGNIFFQDVKYANDSLIYAGGNIGWLVRSTDATETWEVVETPFSVHLRAFDVKGDSIIAVFNEGLIAISADQGNNWITAESNVTVDLRDVKFGENGKIYAVGNSKTLLFSNDNGLTWSDILVPDDAIHNPNDRPNWNFQSLWVDGDTLMMGTGLPGIPIQIVRTTDHGATWQHILPTGVDLPSAIVGAYLTEISFAADGLTGYASYWMLYNNGLAKTTDGGATWDKVTTIANFTPYPNPNIEYTTNDIRFLYSVNVSPDGQNIITAGGFGQVLASTDGGVTWKEIFGGARYGDRDLRSASFQGVTISPDGTSWLASGQRGLLVGASDFETATATILQGEVRPRHFHDMEFFDENNGIAVGSLELQKYTGTSGGYYIFYDGVYFTTADGGDTWSQATGPGMENYEWFGMTSTAEKMYTAGVKYLYDYDEEENLIVFTYGLISSSADGGATWNEEHIVSGAKIIDIVSWGDEYIYALTNGNTLVKKINGGEWENVTLPDPMSTNLPPSSIELSSPEVLFISGGRTGTGGSTYISKSEDAGQSWENVFTSNAGSLNRVTFVDAKHGFTGGQWGTLANRKNLLYTNDYGQTWTPTNTPGTWAAYRELFFLAIKDSVSTIGYGNRGFLGETTDAENFEIIDSYFTEETILNGYFDGAERLFLVGQNGTIVKYVGDAFNTAPGKFANTFPIAGESIFIPWDAEAEFTWEASIDPDGDEVSYVFILESADGNQELFRSEVLNENLFAANTDNFPSIPPTVYRWRVEAHDTEGLYSTSYPTTAFIEVDDFINDQNDILEFSFAEDFSPAEIDTENHTVLARVIYQTDVTNLEPTIVVSINATIEPASGVPQDFSEPVTYVVTAENGDEQEWTVNVIIEDPIDYVNILEYKQFDYTMIPLQQLPPLSFETLIQNEGQRDYTDVLLTVTLNNNEIASSEPLPVLPKGDISLLQIEPPYSLEMTGTLNFWYEVSIGEENANLVGHTAESSVMVTDSVYATDTGVISNSLGSNSGPISLANIYEVTSADYITSITVGWGATLHDFPLDFSLRVFEVDMETQTVGQQVVPTQTFQRYPNMAGTLVSFKIPATYLESGHYAVVIDQLAAVHLRLAFSDVPGGYFYQYVPAEGVFNLIDDPAFGFVILRANFGGLPLSSDATLSDLMVDGQTIDGFSPEVLNYNYILPEGTTDAPPVTAIANDEEATVEITPAADISSPDAEDRTTEVKVTAEDGETVLVYTVTFNVATSINDVATFELNLYPNPAGDYLIVESNSGKGMTIMITSINGKVLQRDLFDESNVKLDISHLPAGLYIIGVISDGKVQNETFSVIRQR